MRVKRERSTTQTSTLKEPLQGGSSQSVRRVQPKNQFPWYSTVAVVFFCLNISCTDDPFAIVHGEWRVDVPRMQASLTSATHARSQAKAAALISSTLLRRYRFTFKNNVLTYGHEHNMRTMQLEYIRTEKKTRLVFRRSDSPFLLRVTPNEGNLLLDFEDKVWHLTRGE